MRAIGAISSEQMKRLLEISRRLTVTADLGALLNHIAEGACELIDCERVSIFLHDSGTDELWTKVALQSKEIRVPAGMGIVGHAFKTNSVVLVPTPYEDPRFNSEPDRRSGFVTRNLLTAPMLDVSSKPVGVIQAVNKRSGSFDGIDETMVELLAGQAGVAIQRYNLQQSAVEAMALRREMELAKGVQEAMIPGAAPHIPGIMAEGWTKAASITGGDCYDLWRTSDGRLGMFVGDATGHGIAPAMVVSQTRTLIRAMCDISLNPIELLAAANKRLEEDLDAGTFVTAFVAFLDPDGRLEWCSAGHGPILIRTSPDSPVDVLDASAPPLGVLPHFDSDLIKPAQLELGGLVCVTTDGIFEAFSPAGEQFGVPRLLDILQKDVRGPLAQFSESLRLAVQEWQQTDEPKDDQTLIVASRCSR